MLEKRFIYGEVSEEEHHSAVAHGNCLHVYTLSDVRDRDESWTKGTKQKSDWTVSNKHCKKSNVYVIVRHL